MNLEITSVDFTQVYQLCMIIIGFGGLVLGTITLTRQLKKDKKRKYKFK